MALLPGLFLALHRAVPGLLALSTARELLARWCRGEAVRACFRLVTFKLAPSTLAPKVEGPVEPSPSQLPGHLRVDIGSKELFVSPDVLLCLYPDARFAAVLPVHDFHRVQTRVVQAGVQREQACKYGFLGLFLYQLQHGHRLEDV